MRWQRAIRSRRMERFIPSSSGMVVKFHDGTTVTAEDVKYSIERCAGINGDGTPLVEAFSNVDKVEIPDESTIDIYLKEPDTEFLCLSDGGDCT